MKSSSDLCAVIAKPRKMETTKKAESHREETLSKVWSSPASERKQGYTITQRRETKTFIAGAALLVTWVLLAFSVETALRKEVLFSAFIIACLMLIRYLNK